MNKQTKISVVLGIVVAMILLVWFFNRERPQKTKEKEVFVSSNWNSRFQPYDKKPMGLYLFTTLSQAHLDSTYKVKAINDWVQMDSSAFNKKEKKTFVFIGHNFGLQNHEVDSVLSQVKSGSTLFLGFNDLTKNLYNKLFKRYDLQYEYDDHVNVYAENHRFNMVNLYQNDTVAKEWRAYRKIESLGRVTTLSTFMEMPNFVRVNYGKGFLYFHANPEMFFNYQLKRLHGFKHAEFVLNQLPKGQNLYLLELGRLSDSFGSESDEGEGEEEGEEDDSYFKQIFQSPMLLTALLLSIVGAVLFVVFRSRRVQPIVPYIEPKKNVTLAFTETITSIYLSKRNPYGLLQVQRKNFYSTVQKHFFIDLSRNIDPKLLKALSEKSNVSQSEIEDLVNCLETKEASSVDEDFITNVNKKMFAFYGKVGVITDKLNKRISDRKMEFKRAILLSALMILGGILLILLGLYFLMISVGVGVALWPVGILLIALGSVRVSRPYLVVDREQMVHFDMLGRKKIFDTNRLISVEMNESGAVFTFKNNKSLIINYWELSKFDKKQFKLYASKTNKLDL